MKKKLFSLTFLMLLAVLLVLAFWDDSETIVLKEEDLLEKSKNYEIYMTDDSLYVSDKDGNSMIYTFSGDKVSEVSMLMTVSSNQAAEAMKNFYMENLVNNDVEEIIVEDNLVTIIYNDEYIKMFENYTKQDLEKYLLESES